MPQLKPFPSLVALCALFIGVGVFVQERITPGSTHGTTPCLIDGQVTPMPDLPEASGIAVSRRVPGRLWTHNDSGQATLFALDGHGTITARVRVSGAAVEDWEAIAAGPAQVGPVSCGCASGDGSTSTTRPSLGL